MTRLGSALGLSILLWSAVHATAASAATVIAPNAAASTEGADGNRYPFYDRFDWFRYQQVYAASQFVDLTAPAALTAIAFRPDAYEQAPFSTTRTVEIRFSTTALAPDALTADFDANAGADETIALSLRSVVLASASMTPLAGPREFDIQIVLDTPLVTEFTFVALPEVSTLPSVLMDLTAIRVATRLKPAIDPQTPEA